MNTRSWFVAALTLVFWSFAQVALAVDPDPVFASYKKRLPKAIYDEVTKVPAQPHFLRGFKRETDEVRQYTESYRFFSTEARMGTEGGFGLIDKSLPGYQLPSGVTSITTKWQYKGQGKVVTVLYPNHHRREADGMYTFWSRKWGEVNMATYSPLYAKYEVRSKVMGSTITSEQWKDIQVLLGWSEFKAIQNFTEASVTEGLEAAVDDFGPKGMDLTNRVIARRSELLKDPDYAKRWNAKIAGTKMTMNDLLPVPITTPDYFLPDLLIVPPSKFIGGWVNGFKVKDSERVMMLALDGLAAQYIEGFILVKHEMTHTNPTLQGIPSSLYFDVEVYAASVSNLNEGVMSYLLHPYMGIYNEMGYAYFGYDAEAAVKKIFPPAFTVSNFDEREFRKHIEIMNVIRPELQDLVRNRDDGLMVQYYTDPDFANAVNMKYCDTAAFLRLAFAMRYKPAGIFDPTKVDSDGKVIPAEVQTAQWLDQERESGRIARLATRAMGATGSRSKKGDELMKITKAEDMNGMATCPVDSRLFGKTEDEIKQYVSILNDLKRESLAGNTLAELLFERVLDNSGVRGYLSRRLQRKE